MSTLAIFLMLTGSSYTWFTVDEPDDSFPNLLAIAATAAGALFGALHLLITVGDWAVSLFA